jgi:hypothetical protein
MSTDNMEFFTRNDNVSETFVCVTLLGLENAKLYKIKYLLLFE